MKPLSKVDVLVTSVGNQVVSIYALSRALLWAKSWKEKAYPDQCSKCDNYGTIYVKDRTFGAEQLYISCLLSRAFGEALK